MTLVGASVSVFSLRKEMAVPPVPVIVPALMIVLLLLAVIPTPPVTDAPVSMLIVLLLLSARMPLPVVPPRYRRTGQNSDDVVVAVEKDAVARLRYRHGVDSDS